LQLAGMPADGGAATEGVALDAESSDDSTNFLDAARVLLEREGIDSWVSPRPGAKRSTGCALRPDITLVDIDLGVRAGFVLTRRLRMRRAGIPCDPCVDHSQETFADLIGHEPGAGVPPKSALSARAISRSSTEPPVTGAAGRAGLAAQRLSGTQGTR